MSRVVKNYEEEYRGNILCPECGSIIPQFIMYFKSTWDTREECPCGYERQYNFQNPHGGTK